MNEKFKSVQNPKVEAIPYHEMPTLESLNKDYRGPLAEQMGIEFVELGRDCIVAKMKVEQRHTQPMGIMNGGVSMVIVETVGSVAAYSVIDRRNSYVLGLEINGNHLRKALPGDTLFARGKPLHLGKKVHVWGVEITNAEGQPVCIGRITVMVQEKK